MTTQVTLQGLLYDNKSCIIGARSRFYLASLSNPSCPAKVAKTQSLVASPLPKRCYSDASADIAASTAYAENWVLVRRADYHAQDQAPSPLQHFWSLAVEEQFYIGWPLLVVGVAGWWRRRCAAKNCSTWSSDFFHHHEEASTVHFTSPPRSAYALPMASLCAISLASAILYARTNSAAGYFMTLTRLHELGLGGLVSVWVPGRAFEDGLQLGSELHGSPAPGHVRLCRTLTATAGLLAIGCSGFFYLPSMPFPGFVALVPVLGAVAVIVAGEGGGAAAHALAWPLAHPWLQYIGDISYSLYLAHWPVVVVYPYMTGRRVDGFLADGAMVVAVSLALSHGCKRLWEDRFRGRAPTVEGPHPEIGLIAACSRTAAPGCTQVASPPTKMPGMLARRSRSTLVEAAVMTVLMASMTLSASFVLHWNAPPQADEANPGSGSELLMLPRFGAPALPLLLDSSAKSAPLTFEPLPGCADFFSANASQPYPGADALLRGCSTLNSVTTSDALTSRYIAKGGQINGKPYPNAFPASFQNAVPSRGHVIILGDSHAKHWETAFSIVGHRLGFNVTRIHKSSCAPSLTLMQTQPGNRQPNVACHEMVTQAINQILQDPPLAVVLVAYPIYKPYADGNRDASVAAGVVQIAKRFVAADIPVLGIKSTPVMKENIPDCLARLTKQSSGNANASACSVSANDALKNGPVEEAASMYPIMRLMSFDNVFCANGTCPPVIGNLVVYGDKHHVSRPYSLSLAPALEQKLREVAPFLANKK